VRIYPRVRKRILARIEHPRLPRAYFLVLERALHRAFCYRNVIGSRLGPVETPDSVAEIADFLLAHERMAGPWSPAATAGSSTSRCGRCGAGAPGDPPELLRGRGTAGGHGRMAGARSTSPASPLRGRRPRGRAARQILALLGFRGKAEFRPLIPRNDGDAPAESF